MLNLAHPASASRPRSQRLTAFPTPGDPRRRPLVQFEWDEKMEEADNKKASRRSRRKQKMGGYRGIAAPAASGGSSNGTAVVPGEDGSARVPGVVTLNPKMYWMPVSRVDLGVGRVVRGSREKSCILLSLWWRWLASLGADGMRRSKGWKPSFFFLAFATKLSRACGLPWVYHIITTVLLFSVDLLCALVVFPLHSFDQYTERVQNS